ncbi:uncharacterized protein PV07_12536 [Cladophialophora immunda]|uniref:Uncharacterized protein n=1 Tax=Cladophialophora immunda TaxID=569365 RepID=A0A0D2CEW2_9EURO|nr:uncharacterized protein PV07_12536 [Cladophialophora immunda]KIW22074.1 hypothetical protein PV07_12536 [Cladophialophora immunda]
MLKCLSTSKNEKDTLIVKHSIASRKQASEANDHNESNSEQRATITVSPEKLARAPRSSRPPAPTSKVRENQALRRTRRTTRAEKSPPLHFRDVEDSDDDYEEEDGDTAASLEELVTLVKELKKTIDQQNDALLEVQTELKELKEEQQYVKEQNNELKDEIGMLRNQLGSLSASLPSTQSWASVVASRNGSGSPLGTSDRMMASVNHLVSHPRSHWAATDTLCCTIDASRVPEQDMDKTSPRAIRATVEKEIRAVTRDAKNASRVRIACRDETELHMVKQVAETKIAPGIRILRDELYPVKVDNVNRLAILDANGGVQAGGKILSFTSLVTSLFSGRNFTRDPVFIDVEVERENTLKYVTAALFVVTIPNSIGGSIEIFPESRSNVPPKPRLPKIRAMNSDGLSISNFEDLGALSSTGAAIHYFADCLDISDQ